MPVRLIDVPVSDNDNPQISDVEKNIVPYLLNEPVYPQQEYSYENGPIPDFYIELNPPSQPPYVPMGPSGNEEPPVTYLIIVDDNIYQNCTSGGDNLVDEFRDWKTQKGFVTKVVKTSEITDFDTNNPEDSSDAVHSFLDSNYQNSHYCNRKC